MVKSSEILIGIALWKSLLNFVSINFFQYVKNKKGKVLGLPKFACNSLGQTVGQTTFQVQRMRVAIYQEQSGSQPRESFHMVSRLDSRQANLRPNKFGRRVQHTETLKRYFEACLSDHPTWKIRTAEKLNLLIDGPTLPIKSAWYCMNHIVKSTLMYRLTAGEWLDEMIEDLQNLINLGVCVESVTCDGLSNIIKAVKAVDPQTITKERLK
ncbi:MAG TPA: hypothetical protein VK152_08925 [Paludibacter sp.]|nr:hypothetical protein [Paludibacter sp.]